MVQGKDGKWRTMVNDGLYHKKMAMGVVSAAIDARDFVHARDNRKSAAHVPDGTLIAVAGGREAADIAGSAVSSCFPYERGDRRATRPVYRLRRPCAQSPRRLRLASLTGPDTSSLPLDIVPLWRLWAVGSHTRRSSSAGLAMSAWPFHGAALRHDLSG